MVVLAEKNAIHRLAILNFYSEGLVPFLLRQKLNVYPAYPHGMCTTHADEINADLLAFIKE